MSRLPHILGASGQRLLAMEQRLDEQAAQFELQRTELAQQRQRLDEQQERLDRQRQRLRQQAALHGEISTTLTGLSVSHAVVEQQLSSLETRMQQLVDSGDHRAFSASEDEQAAARSLLEQVREEHRLIRVRFGVIGRYEERLRRVEDSVATGEHSSVQG
jgi:chromosome segregation ATPase